MTSISLAPTLDSLPDATFLFSDPNEKSYLSVGSYGANSWQAKESGQAVAETWKPCSLKVAFCQFRTRGRMVDKKQVIMPLTTKRKIDS